MELTEEIQSRVLKRLNTLLKDRDIANVELSRLSGINTGNVSAYLTGSKKMALDTMIKFAKALDVDVSYFFELEKEKLKDFEFVCSSCGAVYELKRKE